MTRTDSVSFAVCPYSSKEAAGMPSEKRYEEK